MEKQSDEEQMWGLYPWFPEHGTDLIQEQDLGAFMQASSNCKVYACIGEGEYLILRYNNECYRVKNRLFKAVPTPKFTFGQKVKIVKSGEEVTVTDIMWHCNRKEHYYLVSSGNRKKKKRYFEVELA